MPPRFQEQAVQSLDQLISAQLSEAADAASEAQLFYFASTHRSARLLVAAGVALFVLKRAVALCIQTVVFRRHKLSRACSAALRGRDKNGLHAD